MIVKVIIWFHPEKSAYLAHDVSPWNTIGKPPWNWNILPDGRMWEFSLPDSTQQNAQ